MIQFEIVGLQPLLRKLTPTALLSVPLRKFFQRAAITLQSNIRPLVPVDTGRLRNSIGYQVDPAPLPLYADVGTNVFYAPMMEYGTGRMGDPGMPHKASHWPPAAALDTWARRHGFESGGQVAAIIGRRGGLRARRFMRNGLQASLGAIRTITNQLAADIETAFGVKG